MKSINWRMLLPVTGLITACLLSTGFFLYRNYDGFDSKPIDFIIFASAYKKFSGSNELYKRGGDYPTLYGPSAAIYKFPPPFLFSVAPAVHLPGYINGHFIVRMLLSICYLASLLLLFLYLKDFFLLEGDRLFYFGSLYLITSCWFMPYFESIRWFLFEIPLLLFFVLAFMVWQKEIKLSFSGGLLIGYGAAAKIYPAFMALFFIVRRDGKGLAGVVTGVLASFLLSIILFGWKEHVFYAKEILPTLLNEPVIQKHVNLNLERFFYSIGIWPEINGSLFKSVRLAVLGCLLLAFFRYREAMTRNAILLCSTLISSMYFCFPNYWPQYQIFLIIPAGFLMGIYISHNRPLMLIVLALVLFPLFFSEWAWRDILAEQILSRDLDKDALSMIIEQYGVNSSIWNASPMAYISYFLYEIRSLTTAAIFIMVLEQVRRAKQQAGIC